MFNGRVVEDFKLLTGTFVSVGNLRIAALAAASPLLMDAVVCGHDRDYVGLLAWLNLGAAREIAGEPEAELPDLVRSPKLAEFVRERFTALQPRPPGVLDSGRARRSCWPSRRRWTPTRSRTRATSTSAPRSSGGRRTSPRCSPTTRRKR